MIKFIFKNKLIVFALIALFALAVAVPVVVLRANSYLQGYRINSHSNIPDQIVNPYGQWCKASNHSNNNYFLPNKTAAEWDAVRSFSNVYPSILGISCCGDGVCHGSDDGTIERCNECDNDCGYCATAVCGDGVCEPARGETAASCAYDCPMGCCQRPYYPPTECQVIPSWSECASYPTCLWNIGANACQYQGSLCNNQVDEIRCVAHAGEGCTWAPNVGRCDHFCGDGVCDTPLYENYINCLNDCSPPPGTPYCGDNSCNNGESCSSCQHDCGLCPYCGDGICNNGETNSSCASDCGAPIYCIGGGYCNTYLTEFRCLKNPAEGCSWANAQ